jgi:serine phosphatase RsbU (regulator of sigma subunit)/GGDEF domain-containing protein
MASPIVPAASRPPPASLVLVTAPPMPDLIDLDPLTGLSSRDRFEAMLNEPSNLATHDAVEDGIVVISLDVTAPWADRDSQQTREGQLLLVAELLHQHGDGPDFVARLDDNQVALLIRGDMPTLRNIVNKLRKTLRALGVPGRVGCVLRSGHARNDIAAAIAANDEGPRSHRTSGSGQADAGTIVATARSARDAQASRDHAVGILMHWHQYSAKDAHAELAQQARALVVPIRTMTQLIDAVAIGKTVADVSTQILSPPSLAQAPVFTSMRGAQIAGRYQAATGAAGSGGDWFDAFLLPDGTTALVVGDVSGHDTLAAVAMMQLRSMIRRFAAIENTSPSDALALLDEAFGRLNQALLATVFFGQLTVTADGSGRLRWCNAGHLPPILMHRDGSGGVLTCADDVLLGLGTPSPRHDLTAVLPPGSTLLLYTDGLVETRHTDLDNDLARMRSAAQPLVALPANDLCDMLIAAMVPPHTPDDATLLTIRLPG